MIRSLSRLILASSLFLATVSALRADDGPLHPTGLRCEYLTNPLGIDETAPRLSWIDESTGRAERQTAYQILVASDADALRADRGDLWDSGKVASAESAQIVYAGTPLVSRLACFWTVRVWDRDGVVSAWSQPARWSMGLLVPGDWQARWIGHPSPDPATLPPITIQQAIYETTDGVVTRDVTAVLAAYIREHNPDALKVSNDLLSGDPALNQHKRLRVEFMRGDEHLVQTVAEGANLQLRVVDTSLPSLRKVFTVAAPPRRATLYVTALGLYECRLNGQRVGDAVLAPDWTDYHRRVRYQAYDVTAFVRPGENVLGALLANGWYAGHLGNGGFQQYGTSPALLAQLEITDADGRVEPIVTDGTWQTHASDITASDFMLGESCDARLETPGWDRPGFDARDWPAAVVRPEKARELDSQVCPPVRATGERPPVALTEPAPGRWTFDLGQNMVGVVRLRVTASAGTRVTIHHAEMLNPNGTIYTANLRSAASVDTYTCRGGGEEIWQPKFTFHGFRYVEVTGLPARPSADAVTGIVLGTDNPSAGSFACSDARINQLASNIAWGQRGNYLSVPTDCPQRDERLGWMGDAQVFVRTATDFADVAAFFTKWLVDVDDAQRPDGAFTDVSPWRGSAAGTPAWADAGVICPWTIYEAYGDRRILERHLPAMTRWVEWCRAHSVDLLRERDRGADYGDWLSQGENTPKDVIGTAYFAYSTHLLAKSYRAVGDDAAARKYEELFGQICEAFDQAYVAPDGRIKGNTQCAYAMALRFDLLPETLRSKGMQYLADDIAVHGNHLTTGFIGVGYLLPVLTNGGRLDMAYALLTQDTFPSWLFSVKQGATTIWERWDGWTPGKGFQDAGMNSFNHYSLGSCGEWLYDTVAGIGWNPEAPGYRRLILRPQPGGGLSHAEATRRTMYGTVKSAWRVDGKRLTLDVTIPANVTARMILPTGDAASILEGGNPLEGNPTVAPGETAFDVGSGSYQFSWPVTRLVH